MSKALLEPLENCRVCGTKLRLIEKTDKIPLDGAKFEKDECMPNFYDSALYLCPQLRTLSNAGFCIILSTEEFRITKNPSDIYVQIYLIYRKIPARFLK